MNMQHSNNVGFLIVAGPKLFVSFCGFMCSQGDIMGVFERERPVTAMLNPGHHVIRTIKEVTSLLNRFKTRTTVSPQSRVQSPGGTKVT